MDQDDVLKKKGRTTRSSLGLQQWGNDPAGAGIGEGSAGTAERAAKIARMQEEKDEA